MRRNTVTVAVLIAALTMLAAPAHADLRRAPDRASAPQHLVRLEIDPMTSVIRVLPARSRDAINSSFTMVSALCNNCGQCPSTARDVEVVLEATEDVAAGYGVSDLRVTNYSTADVTYSTQGALSPSGNEREVTITISGEVLSCGRTFKIYFSMCDSEPAEPTDACPATIPADCRTILAANPDFPDGVYTVDPDGPAGQPAFDVYCDMTRHGGGWTQIGRIGQSISPSSAFDSDLLIGSLAFPPPAAPTEYAHLDLARFDSLGNDWEVRSTVDAVNDGTHHQHTFFRPAAGMTCPPSLAGTNWWGTNTYTLLEHLTRSTTTGMANTTWLPLLPYDQAGPTNLWLFGYRSISFSGSCLDGANQTKYCHAPAGAICNEGLPGTYTAAFGMNDGYPHSWGRRATFWIR